jgi:hypothetical protein
MILHAICSIKHPLQMRFRRRSQSRRGSVHPYDEHECQRLLEIRDGAVGQVFALELIAANKPGPREQPDVAQWRPCAVRQRGQSGRAWESCSILQEPLEFPRAVIPPDAGSSSAAATPSGEISLAGSCEASEGLHPRVRIDSAVSRGCKHPVDSHVCPVTRGIQSSDQAFPGLDNPPVGRYRGTHIVSSVNRTMPVPICGRPETE